MLEVVPLQPKRLEDYRQFIGDEEIAAIQALAEPLKGARFLHINVDGPKELDGESLVPLMRDVGIDARWEVIRGEDEFFNVTKAFHNALQGAPVELTPEMRVIYNRYNEQNAADLEGEYDSILVHDPQPAALRHFHNPAAAKHWITRIHIDTSTPNPAVPHQYRIPTE